MTDNNQHWVGVTTAPHQPIADMIVDVLAQEAIPTVVRRLHGFDVPDFLPLGPRLVMVRSDDEERARQVLDAMQLPLD